LTHTSNEVETHYHSLVSADSRRILLHTHFPAPYHDHLSSDGKGVHFTIYSSGAASCISGLKGLEISIDWCATLGRCASRYLTTTIAWAAGVSSMTLFLGLGMYDQGGTLCMFGSQLLLTFCLNWSFTAPMPSLDQSMRRYSQLLWRSILPMSLFASFMPWPTKLYLGLGIAGPFAPLVPLILLTASGLVIAIWWILIGFKWLLRPVGRVLVARWGVPTS